MPGETTPKHLACSICSRLLDEISAYEHVHSPEEDTDFPAEVKSLKTVLDIKPGHPGKTLLQCPQCGTYYLYKTSYEYLIGFSGSYDEYTIMRITDEEGLAYLEGRKK